MQDNFTAFSVKIFEKHGEIMENLNRVENTADKILKQLGKDLHSRVSSDSVTTEMKDTNEDKQYMLCTWLL
jgi:hypothetical protein